MEYFIIAILFIALVFLMVHYAKNGLKKSELEETQMEERLMDEYIIDPETGTKLTLEQAESGNWTPDPAGHVKSEEEIEALHTEGEKSVARAIKYIFENPEYVEYELSEEQVDNLEDSMMFQKYDSVGFDGIYKWGTGHIYFLLPEVLLNYNHRDLGSYNETQCLFWARLKMNGGHYHFLERPPNFYVLELIGKTEEIALKYYETSIYEEAQNKYDVIDLLDNFQGIRNFEFEIMGRNLFIKNMKYMNTEDIQYMEEILKKIKKFLM